MNQESYNVTKLQVRKEKERWSKTKIEAVLFQASYSTKHALENGQQKGASSWLNIPLLHWLGYTLTQQKLRDNTCLRYNWAI